MRKAKFAAPKKLTRLCFNGAALFQVRKDGVFNGEIRLDPGFNGAALFQVRKVREFTQEGRAVNGLQWGRTLSSAESFAKCGLVSRRLPCFNGAALFQVRKVMKAEVVLF